MLTSVFERAAEFYKLRHVAFSAFVKVRTNVFRKENKISTSSSRKTNKQTRRAFSDGVCRKTL